MSEVKTITKRDCKSELRTMYLLPEDEMRVRYVSEGATVEAVHKISELQALSKEVTVFHTDDPYGDDLSFVVHGATELHDVYVMKAMTGSAHPVSGKNTVFYREMRSRKMEMRTVEELHDIDFKETYPAVMLPKKRTELEDADYFLERLDTDDENKYIINLDDMEEMDLRLRQLTRAGIGCRPHHNIPIIYLGETQAICWPMKLLINGLCSDREEYDSIIEDLMTRQLINPVHPWTEITRDVVYQGKSIYEGLYERNFVPIMPPIKTPEKGEFIGIEFTSTTPGIIQTTWYGS